MLPSFSPVCGWGKLRRLLFCIWCSTIIPSSYYVCTFSEECEGNLQQQFPWEVLKRTFNRAQGKPTIRRNGITKYLLQLKKEKKQEKENNDTFHLWVLVETKSHWFCMTTLKSLPQQCNILSECFSFATTWYFVQSGALFYLSKS